MKEDGETKEDLKVDDPEVKIFLIVISLIIISRNRWIRINGYRHFSHGIRKNCIIQK